MCQWYNRSEHGKSSGLVLGPYLLWSSHLRDPLLHFHAGDLLTGNQCPSFVATIFGHPYCVLFLSAIWCIWAGCVRFSYHLTKGEFHILNIVVCVFRRNARHDDIALQHLHCLMIGSLIGFFSSPLCFCNGANANMRGPTAGLQMNLVKNMQKKSRN